LPILDEWNERVQGNWPGKTALITGIRGTAGREPLRQVVALGPADPRRDPVRQCARLARLGVPGPRRRGVRHQDAGAPHSRSRHRDDQRPRHALGGATLEIHGDGRRTRDFIHVDHRVRAIRPPATAAGAGDARRGFADTSKARDRLGWRAETALGDGLRQSVEWFISRSGMASAAE